MKLAVCTLVKKLPDAPPQHEMDRINNLAHHAQQAFKEICTNSSEPNQSVSNPIPPPSLSSAFNSVMAPFNLWPVPTIKSSEGDIVAREKITNPTAGFFAVDLSLSPKSECDIGNASRQIISRSIANWNDIEILPGVRATTRAICFFVESTATSSSLSEKFSRYFVALRPGSNDVARQLPDAFQLFPFGAFASAPAPSELRSLQDIVEEFSSSQLYSSSPPPGKKQGHAPFLAPRICFILLEKQQQQTEAKVNNDEDDNNNNNENGTNHSDQHDHDTGADGNNDDHHQQQNTNEDNANNNDSNNSHNDGAITNNNNNTDNSGQPSSSTPEDSMKADECNNGGNNNNNNEQSSNTTSPIIITAVTRDNTCNSNSSGGIDTSYGIIPPAQFVNPDGPSGLIRYYGQYYKEEQARNWEQNYQLARTVTSSAATSEERTSSS